jgi:aminopeptidase N
VSDRSSWEDAMRERTVCRHLGDGIGRWTLREEAPKYAPDRTCDVEHLRLDLKVDLPHKHIEAVCTQRLRAAYGPFDMITLDAVDLKIHSVKDGKGQNLRHTYLDNKLTIRFPRRIADAIDLVISYEVDHPDMGLYFVGPTDAEPNATWQLWSQGEDEEARYWIPCHDAPNERMTTEVLVTVDEGFTAISNGALLSVKKKGGKRTFHFLESVPHVSYLITLVVGAFSRLEDQWREIPVQYFVEPGREEEALRSFGKTPQMIDFFSRVLDYPYPYEKYTQVAVRHFMFGGMENTSATTQTDGTLHDRRAGLDFSSEELVSHELAHQWFGDLLTCKSWAHAWLNEGFATYFEALWKEEDLGRAEFDNEMLMNAAMYMAEPYRRAIVSNRYAYPQDLFDMHLYPKGGWVLHMLRRKLGDDLFWKALRLYTRRHEKGCVETVDLIRAFEDASGKNLTGFFDQWVMSPGHPEIEGSASWNAKEKRVEVSLKQAQKLEGGVPVFKIPIRIECRRGDGGVVGGSFEMEKQEQTFYLAVAEEPVSVVIDPELAVLATWKVTRPPEWLEATLLGKTQDPRVPARFNAVRQLAEKPTYKGETILGRVAREDPFWAVQAEASRALGKIRSPHALDLLLKALDVKHPKARRAVVTALGAFRARRAAEALHRILSNGDASYFVEASAAASLGRTGVPGALPVLRAVLKRPSWHDVIAALAAEGLAALRDESVTDDLLSVASDRARYWGCRLSAMNSLANLGAARPNLAPRIAESLTRFLDDPDVLIARRVAGALVTLGNESAVPALRRAASSTPDPRTTNHYLMAAEDLAAQRKRGEDVDKLRSELEKLQGEAKEMRETIRKIEEKVSPVKKERGKRPGRKPGRRD